MADRIGESRAIESLRALLRHSPASDAELLARHLDRRDPNAFAELVERHGPMVLGVARRHCAAGDCDDVFQATFWLLARDARKIKQDNLAGWLYRVALRTARRRGRRPASLAANWDAPDPNAGDPTAGAAWRELASALDAELTRLPDDLTIDAKEALDRID